MANRSLEDRRKALNRGRISEYVAAAWLMLRGYRILAMRYRAKSGEVDIIARKGQLVAFVEVKARRTPDQAVFAVNQAAQSRITNASLFWLARRPDAAELSLRYDIVAICPWKLPVHFADAF